MARTEPYVSAPPDAAEMPYQGIGAELRAAREAMARSVDMVASSLRIRRPHIQAIEDGRFHDLPGQVYAVGFIRAYAEFLRLDADVAVERFREESDGPSPKLELHFPEPASRRGRMDVRALLVGLIIAVGAYGTWNYLQTRGELPRELVASVPSDLLIATDETPAMGTTTITEPSDALAPTVVLSEEPEPSVAPTENVDTADADTEDRTVASEHRLFQAGAAPRVADDLIELASNPPAERPAEPGPVPSEAAVSALMAAVPPRTVAARTDDPSPASEPADNTARVSPAPPTVLANDLPAVPMAPLTDYEPRVYGQGNTDARVVVRARTESWVQVEGSDNELLLTRVLNPGDMFLVPNRSDLRLVTGNAGGIDILVDGVLMPPLGPEGTVRRNVRLTPDALTGADTVSLR